ncbi:hypothetical protein BASA61_003958 [Batrachochytrium salamandrivorans]|nr:hypothetical protein BASA61_003958 [Batrachochytrium salamandrivorans]
MVACNTLISPLAAMLVGYIALTSTPVLAIHGDDKPPPKNSLSAHLQPAQEVYTPVPIEQRNGCKAAFQGPTQEELEAIQAAEVRRIQRLLDMQIAEEKMREKELAALVKKEEEERLKKEQEKKERLQKAEEERIRKEQEKKERLQKEEEERIRKEQRKKNGSKRKKRSVFERKKRRRSVFKR